MFGEGRPTSLAPNYLIRKGSGRVSPPNGRLPPAPMMFVALMSLDSPNMASPPRRPSHPPALGSVSTKDLYNLAESSGSFLHQPPASAASRSRLYSDSLLRIPHRYVHQRLLLDLRLRPERPPYPAVSDRRGILQPTRTPCVKHGPPAVAIHPYRCAARHVPSGAPYSSGAPPRL